VDRAAAVEGMVDLQECSSWQPGPLAKAVLCGCSLFCAFAPKSARAAVDALAVAAQWTTACAIAMLAV
jgi:hypothetical protein